jgi:hypothetical protein
MREPVALRIEREEEFYTAEWRELNEFGYDMDPISAVQDLRNTIAELYWQLRDFDLLINKFGFQSRHSGDLLAWFEYDGKVVVRTANEAQPARTQPSASVSSG